MSIFAWPENHEHRSERRRLAGLLKGAGSIMDLGGTAHGFMMLKFDDYQGLECDRLAMRGDFDRVVTALELKDHDVTVITKCHHADQKL